MAETVSVNVERDKTTEFQGNGNRKKPRYAGGYRLLSRVTYGHLCDIVRLAPKGREIDKLAILRAAQSVILGQIVGEIEGADNTRRKSLCEAFRMLHDCEIETAKMAPDMALNVTGANAGSNLVELHLPDFVRRHVDNDDD